jgi:hypothetical protein
MWVKTSTRKELLEILQSGRMVASPPIWKAESVPPSFQGGEELQLLWADDPGNRPPPPAAVLVDTDKRRDFLAWVLTYAPSFRPFTAYCRVSDPATAGGVLRRTGTPSLGRLEDVCVGLVLGEAATYVGGRLEPRDLTRNACASTYSYAMTRALSLGLVGQDADLVGNEWAAARNLTRQSKLSLDTPELRGPWAVVLLLAAGEETISKSVLGSLPKRVADACLDLYKTGDIQSQQWEALMRDLPGLREVKDRMYGPREERVITLEHSLRLLLNSRISDSTSADFLGGYLASQVSPGTLDHFALVLPHLRAFPTAFLWYGLCAGLRQPSNVLNFSDGLGRRVIRDVLRNEGFLDRPRCDIALVELDVVSRSDGLALDFRTTNPGLLEVEIAPCTTTLVRWPGRAELQPELFSSLPQTAELRELLADLELAFDRAERIRRKLAKLLGSPDTSRDGPDAGNRRR